jgi:hypothetical protein
LYTHTFKHNVVIDRPFLATSSTLPPINLIVVLSLFAPFFSTWHQDETLLKTCNAMTHAVNDPANYMSVDHGTEVGVVNINGSAGVKRVNHGFERGNGERHTFSNFQAIPSNHKILGVPHPKNTNH